MSDIPDEQLGRLADFFQELGHLKSTPRTGWVLAGIPVPESVAEHSYRTAVIGVILAHLEGADPGRTAIVCLMHDIAETRLGDIPSVGKSYLQAAPDQEVVADQTRGMPESVIGLVCDAVREYKERQSAESVLAKDADKLECLAQACEYEAAGHPRAQYWVDASINGLRSDSAKRLAEIMRTRPPENWWREFVELYGAHIPAE